MTETEFLKEKEKRVEIGREEEQEEGTYILFKVYKVIIVENVPNLREKNIN